MNNRKEMPELSLFRRLVDYDPETGIFIWKERPDDLFEGKRKLTNTWNKRFAGMPALCTLNHNGYLYGAIFGSNYSTHRMAWYFIHGVNPDEIDHINGVRTDNRICNLRHVDRKENCKNAKRQARNTSGVSGVAWDSKNAKWQVRIGRRHIGRFRDFEEAVSARKAAELQNGFHANHGR